MGSATAQMTNRTSSELTRAIDIVSKVHVINGKSFDIDSPSISYLRNLQWFPSITRVGGIVRNQDDVESIRKYPFISSYAGYMIFDKSLIVVKSKDMFVWIHEIAHLIDFHWFKTNHPIIHEDYLENEFIANVVAVTLCNRHKIQLSSSTYGFISNCALAVNPKHFVTPENVKRIKRIISFMENHR